MAGEDPARFGAHDGRPRVAAVRLQVGARIELGQGAGGGTQQALPVGRMLAVSRVLVDLDPFDAGTRTDLDPATGSFGQRPRHGWQQRLQHQRKQQDAGKQSSVAGGSEHGGGVYHEAILRPAGQSGRPSPEIAKNTLAGRIFTVKSVKNAV